MIRSESGYRRVFGPASPGIDFDHDVVVFYSAGTKNTGGYGAEIASIEKRGQRLNVTTLLTVPASDCVVTQARTTPCVLARVHGAGRVRQARFEHKERSEACQDHTRCGGIAGLTCPGSGSCDRDDPTDDCDPERGADCLMLCSCNIRALCIPGLIFDESPLEDPVRAGRLPGGRALRRDKWRRLLRVGWDLAVRQEPMRSQPSLLQRVVRRVHRTGWCLHPTRMRTLKPRAAAPIIQA